MALTSKQRKFLKQKAHPLKPVVLVGDSGLTEAVTAAAEEAIAHHELIKVRFQQGDRQQRREATEALAERLGADTVQTIGRVTIFYRPAEEPAIQLPE
jgi:RNA-binding protein